VAAELTKASRSAFEHYRRRGWAIETPALVEYRRDRTSSEARDRWQARAGGVGFIAHMSPPDGAAVLHGYGGTPEDAAQDVLGQAARAAR